MRGINAMAALVAAAVIGAGCGGGSTTATATTTSSTVARTTITTLSRAEIAAAELTQDLPLIKALWRNLSDSWAAGNDRGLEVGWEATYPGLPDISTETCRSVTFPDGPIKGYEEEYVLDVATVEPDPGWRYPPVPDFALDGRIYIMSVTIAYSAPGYAPQPPSTAEVHVAIKDGKAYHFPDCRPT